MTKDRLVPKVIFYIISALTFFLAGMALKPDRQITLPDFLFSLSENQDILNIQGTWELTDESSAWPIQSTSMECSRKLNLCTEATAVIAENIFLPVTLNKLRILSWTTDQVTVEGPKSACVDEVYTVAMRTRSVTGLATRRAECNVAGDPQKRMRMIGRRSL